MADTTYMIAEAGVNHNGSLDMTEELVKAAADCVRANRKYSVCGVTTPKF